MSKFYAVKGENNKIFTDWGECQAFISENKGKGYKHKSFSTEEEAVAFLEGRDYYAEVISKDLSEGFVIAFTDGSFEESVGKYSYGVVAVSPDGKERTFSGRGEELAFLPTRNIAGEVEGVLTAVRWAFLNGYYKIKIYHDYEGLSAWAEGRWNASSPISVYYLKEFAKYKGAVEVCFEKVKGHSNHKYNEMVDKLAKEALFEGKFQPLKGFGYKVSGNSVYRDLISWINQKAPKAKFEARLGGTLFSYNGEKLAVYPRFTSTSIVGSGGFLYFIALSCVLANLSQMGVNRLIERCLGVEIDKTEEIDGFEISYIALDLCIENYAPAVLFSLEEVERAIKKELDEIGKISTRFKRVNDTFECDEKTSKKHILEEAYAFFYENRLNYFSLKFNREQAVQVIERARTLTAKLKAEE